MLSYKRSFKWLILATLSYSSFYCTAQNIPIDSIPRLTQILKTTATDTNRVNLFLSISNAYRLKPGEDSNDLNLAIKDAYEAEHLSKTVNYLDGLGRSYISLAGAFREKGNHDKSQLYAQKAVSMIKYFLSKLDAADAWKELGSSYDQWDQNELAKKIQCYSSAVQLLKESGGMELYASNLLYLADLNSVAGNSILSLTQCFEALNIYHTIGFKDLLFVYDLLGKNYRRFSNYSEALKYGLLSVQIGEQRKDTGFQMCTTYFRVGAVYAALGESGKALDYFNKSMYYAQKYKGEEDYILHIASNAAEVMTLQGKTLEAIDYLESILKSYPTVASVNGVHINYIFVSSYLQLKQYKKAKQFVDKTVQLSDSLPLSSPYRPYIYQAEFPFYLKTGNYTSAKKSIDEFVRFCDQDTLSTFMAETFLWKFQLDSVQGNYLEAIKNYQKYKSINDFLFNETKSNQIASVNVQFETSRKEQDIQSLQHVTELQQTKLAKERILKNVVIISAISLFFILLLLYSRYRLKQKTNRQLLIQQRDISHKNDSLMVLNQELHKLIKEKEWLVKEIHHRIKNNLQIVVSLLNTQAAHLNEGEALNAISESRHRMQAFSLLHQRLYQLDNSSYIRMDQYIDEMVSYLKDSFPSSSRIRFNLKIAAIELDVTQAAPVGLLLNEAVTNALKYAFVSRVDGVIDIQMKLVSENAILFVVADNGIGLPANWSARKNESMGINLIETLGEQLDGTVNIYNTDGVTIELNFCIQRHDIPFIKKDVVDRTASYA